MPVKLLSLIFPPYNNTASLIVPPPPLEIPSGVCDVVSFLTYTLFVALSKQINTLYLFQSYVYSLNVSDSPLRPQFVLIIHSC